MQKLSIIIAANHSHYICSRHLMIKMNSHKKCPTYYETYFISLSAKFISDRYTDDPKWLRNWTIWSKVVEDYFPCFLKDGFWLTSLKSSRISSRISEKKIIINFEITFDFFENYIELCVKFQVTVGPCISEIRLSGSSQYRDFFNGHY